MSVSPHRRGVFAHAALLGAGVIGVVLAGLAAPAEAAGPARPNLVKASAYLASPANLIGGHYYRSFGRAADFGMTLDGALALAATGDDVSALRSIVGFLDDGGKDAAGKTIDYWTGIGTRYASGGAIAKEALLAEVVGDNPRHFGGHDLIAALDGSVCGQAGEGGAARCPAAGSYTYAASVFDQSLGVMAQLRAGQHRRAAAPAGYLESLQNPDGSFPSLIPGTGADVDSTAIAVMALRLESGRAAAAAVRSGIAWIASSQEHNGGFPGAGGDSVNSAGLAIQALTLRRGSYGRQIAAAEAFLAREQNADGGFDVAAHGPAGSNLRASTQAISGATGTSFGTLRRNLGQGAAAHPARGRSLAYLTYPAALVAVLLITAAAVVARRRRRRSGHGPAPAERDRAGTASRPGP